MILECKKRPRISTMVNKKNFERQYLNLFYRDYKKFEENKFAEDLIHELQEIKNPSYTQFEKAFVKVLDNHVPLKKQLRFNHSSFMMKALRKAIMTHSRLTNIYNKNRSYDNWVKYKKQTNFCVKLMRKTKQDHFNNIGYFNNIDIESASDTKKF